VELYDERGVRHVVDGAGFLRGVQRRRDDRHITSIDEDGVALAAIKALNARVERRDALLDAKLAAKDARIDALQRQMATCHRSERFAPDSPLGGALPEERPESRRTTGGF